eukprot:GHVU01196005.1.p2 GENE.GHVU01196005.1~~GHVU01196005.1.p2  ORF type:complete len:110 (-),score=7.49 GHVU01196005.1:48-377(-)
MMSVKSTSCKMSLSIDILTNPTSLSCPMDERVSALTRFKVENDRSHPALETIFVKKNAQHILNIGEGVTKVICKKVIIHQLFNRLLRILPLRYKRKKVAEFDELVTQRI